MTGIITSLPPLVEQPPGNNASNPAGLPGYTYTVAVLGIPQTWTALQTFPAGNISLHSTDIVGTIPTGLIPAPTASTLGGVNSIASASHNWIAYIDTAGLPHQSQPAFSDISGSIAPSQIPNPSSSTLGGVQSAASVLHQWINSISTSGAPALSQPAFTDISGSVAATQMPALTGEVTTSAGGVATTIAANAVTNAKLATMLAWTFKVNNTSGTATPTDITIDGLTVKASPAAGDELMIWDVAGSALKKATVSSVGASSGVSSIAGNTGAFTLTGGITNSTNAIKLSLTNTTLQTTALSPTGTTSATGVMMGLGSTCTLTPSYSGRIKVDFQCQLSNSGTSAANTISLRYGTGTAPVNGAALTGTVVGGTINAQLQTAAVISPAFLSGIITGLTPGTAYWFDISLGTSAGTSTAASVSCNAFEF